MFVFHAGPHKTGTTYVQQNFKQARADLAALGWLYPEEGCGPYAGQQVLGHAGREWLAEGGPGRAELAPVVAAVAEGMNVVMSTEAAARWTPERYHVLAGLLGKEMIDVVYVLRDPIERLYSYWIEQVKQGLPQSFADRVAEHLADPIGSDIVNPLPVLKALIADPRIRLHAVPYEVLRVEKIDLYSHICAAVLGLEAVVPKRTKPSNIALSIYLTEFLRLMTLVVAGPARRIDSAMRLRFFAGTGEDELQELVQLVTREGQAARRRIRFPADVLIRDELEVQLRENLAGHWTHDPGDTPLFKREAREYAYYDAFVLMQVPEIVEAVHANVARFRDPPPDTDAS